MRPRRYFQPAETPGKAFNLPGVDFIDPVNSEAALTRGFEILGASCNNLFPPLPKFWHNWK
jgi:hypothetical protein